MTQSIVLAVLAVAGVVIVIPALIVGMMSR